MPNLSRIAIATSYAPEWHVLLAEISARGIATQIDRINGIDFAKAEIAGREVVIYLSGMSMVNGAMAAQLVLDRFNIRALVLTGIAGALDPALKVGDVLLPEAWAQYLEAAMAREDAEGFAPPPFLDPLRADLPPFGMIHPLTVEVATARSDQRERHLWFPAAPRLLEAAKRAAARVELTAESAAGHRLSHQPRVLTGGRGLSGPAFVDNAALRDWMHQGFGAQVVDMESAALAHVAYCNGVDFIAIRSASDLAGGGAGANEMATFMELAAVNSVRVLLALLAEMD